MGGEGVVTIDGAPHLVAPGSAVDIPVGAAHRIANTGDEALVFIVPATSPPAERTLTAIQSRPRESDL